MVHLVNAAQERTNLSSDHLIMITKDPSDLNDIARKVLWGKPNPSHLYKPIKTQLYWDTGYLLYKSSNVFLVYSEFFNNYHNQIFHTFIIPERNCINVCFLWSAPFRWGGLPFGQSVHIPDYSKEKLMVWCNSVDHNNYSKMLYATEVTTLFC
jgi:hypothetical protein